VSRRANATLFLVLIAYAMQQTAVFPSLPTIRDDLHTTTAWASWIFSAYLLVAATAAAIVGKLGDHYGKRRLLLVALGLFFVGSVGSALAPNIWLLISARAVQGVGGAVVPLAIAIVKDLIPPARVGGVLGSLFAMLAVGTSLGVVAGGFVADRSSWRLIFAFASVSVGAALVLTRLFIPESAPRAPSRVDVKGAVLLALGVSSLLLALTEAEHWGWASPQIVGLLLGSALVVAAWFRVELRTPEPMVQMRMLRDRTVLLATVASVLHSVALFTPLVLLPTFLAAPRGLSPAIAARLDYGFGASATQIGLYFLPGFFCGVFTGSLTGRAAARFGSRVMLAAGMSGMCAGCLSIALWHDRPWQVILGLTAFGLSNPVAASSGINLLMAAVLPTETGIAAGLNHTIRTIGATVVVQVDAAILAAHHLAGTAVATGSAFVAVMLISAVSAALGLPVARLIRPRRPGSGAVALAPGVEGATALDRT
jgi:MFS family permease